MGIFSGGSFPTSGGTVIITQDGYQTLNLTGNILTISGSNSSVDLSSYLDDTNTTNTSLTLNASNVLTLTDSDSGTVTVDLTSLVTAAGGTAESTHIPVKNTSGATITKGTPVYITGNVGSSNRLQIAPADASDPAKMPAIGLLETDLINNAEGYVVQGGYLTNITTDIIDGTSTSSNDTVYVKVGGGITMTKPTGSTNYIQNIAKIARVGSGSSGSLIVSSILRTNDIPNLADGQVWVGSTTYPVSTDFNLQEVTNGGNTTTNKITINRSTTDHIELYNTNYSSGVSISASAGYLNVKPDSASYGMIFRNSADNTKYLVFNTNASDYGEIRYKETSSKIIIHNNGNIGINKTSPDAKLHIVGSGNTSGTTALLVENSAGTDLLNINDSGYISSRIDNYYFRGVSDNVIHTRINNNSGEGIFSLNNGGTTKVYLRANGSSYFTGGSVGIGTSSPSAKTHIVGSGNTSGTTALLVENSAGTDLFKITDNGVAYFETANYFNSSNYQRSGGQFRFYNSDNSNYLRMFHSGASGLYISSADNGHQIMNLGYEGVGINTSSSSVISLRVGNHTSSMIPLLVEASDASDLFQVLESGSTKLAKYGSGSFTGTAAYTLAVDSSGNIIETTRTYQTKSSLSFNASGEATVTLPSTALYGVTATLESSAAEFIVIAQYLAGTSVKFKLYDHTGSAVASVTRTVHYTYTI